jgi:hypothetical protein
MAGDVEFQDRAMVVGAGQEKRLLPGEREPIVAATGKVVQDGGRLAIPSRQRARDQPTK